MQKVHTFGERKRETKKMGEMRENGETKTGRKLVEESGFSPDVFRMRLAKLKRENHPLFREISWSLETQFGESQCQILMMGKAPKRADEGYLYGKGPANEQAPQTAPKVVVLDKPKAAPQPPTQEIDWPVWAVLIIVALVSVPQMYQITAEIKGGAGLSAFAWTAVLTAVPWLLVIARLKGAFVWFVMLLIMGYTAFCNTTSIFAGLTELDQGVELKPTRFLETVTNMLNTGYLGTARGIALFMSVLAMLIEVLAFGRLSKVSWNRPKK